MRLAAAAVGLVSTQNLLKQPHPLFCAALDSGAAGRVASYVLQVAAGQRAAAAESGAADALERPGDAAPAAAPAQFIIVSHRPQVFERARCLLGVYGGARGSEAVVARM